MTEFDKKRLNSAFDDKCAEFEKGVSMTQEHNMKFSEHMRKLMSEETAIDSNGCPVLIDNAVKFCAVTGLGRSIFYRLKEDSYIPSLPTFVTVSMVYALDLPMVITLRESLGLSFCRTNLIHNAYCYIITTCRRKSLSYCNKVLQTLGVEEKYFLGDKMIDEYAVLNEIADDEDDKIG